MKLIAKTLFGLESVLAEDLKKLGATDIAPLNRAVAFSGDLSLLYRANLYLHTCIKILRPIISFDATNEQSFYDQIYAQDWAQYLTVDQTFAIDSTVKSDFFQHSKYLALKMKDGLVDKLRDKLGKRPSVDVANPDVRLNLHVYKSQVTIALDSSGDLLNRRGYRNVGHLAPLNEVLAAGMLKLADWAPGMPLHDPMCGTGTILLEAALMSSNTPAGWYKRYFGFMAWPDFDRSLWHDIRKEAEGRIIQNPKVNFYGGDIDMRAVRSAEESVRFLKLENSIKVERKSFENQKPQSFHGKLITNPPYGERMLKADILAFYKMIGDQLKSEFAGYHAWLLTSNMDALKNVGLRPSRKIPMFNGPLECRFVCYELYQGSKRDA